MPEITKKDMIAWLDMQRAAAVDRFHKLEDGEESHIERSPEAEEINVIVALREQLQEMTAVEYLTAVNSAWHSNEPDDRAFARSIIRTQYDTPKLARNLVRKWKEEHHD